MDCLNLEERLHDFSLIVILAAPPTAVNKDTFEANDDIWDIPNSSQHEGNCDPHAGQPPCNPIATEEGRPEGYSAESEKFVFSADRENLDCKNRQDGVESLKRKSGRPRHSSGNVKPFKKARTKMLDCFKGFQSPMDTDK